MGPKIAPLTLDAINDLLDRKFEPLVKKDDLETILTNRLTIITAELKVFVQNELAERDEKIHTLSVRIDEKDTEITELRGQLNTLRDDLEDQTNRSMRNNIILKGVPETEKEDTRELTKEILANFSDDQYTIDDLESCIDRTHRGKQLKTTTARNRNTPRHIYIKFVSSRTVDDFILYGRKRENGDGFRVDRQYSMAVTKRRNEAMMTRKTLKENGEIVGGYVEYPAKLMVRRQGEKTYSLKQEF